MFRLFEIPVYPYSEELGHLLLSSLCSLFLFICLCLFSFPSFYCSYSIARLRKPLLGVDEKGSNNRSMIENQATKRQKIEGGFLQKVQKSWSITCSLIPLIYLFMVVSLVEILWIWISSHIELPRTLEIVD